MPPTQSKRDITISEFNMKQVGTNKIIVMIGPRGSGKSTILLDYLYHNKDIPFVTCIAPTDIYNGTYTPHVPSRFIYADYSPELIARFVKRQQELKARKMAANMGQYDRRYADMDSRGLIILDDALDKSEDWKKDRSLSWIFYNGRHADVTLILTMQYQLGIRPNFRTNIDWVFLCREVKKLEKEKLWKNYASIFPDYNMFDQVFMHCTADNCCMVIKSITQDTRIEDQVFWYKARIHGDFRICYKDFWENNDYYLKKRLASLDATGAVMERDSSTVKRLKEEEDYYKYATRGKVRYEVNMSEGDNEYDEYDYEDRGYRY
jgi:hypothetical protein